MPAGGLEVASYLRGRGVDVDAARARMRALMSAEGLAYDPGPRMFDSRLAQELGTWGDAEGKPAIHDALYRAYFADHGDLSDVDTLVAVAAEVKLDPKQALDVLLERRFRDSVDRQWERAIGVGVTGVPTFVIGRTGVVGAQPYEVLERMVRAAGARPRDEQNP